MSQVLCPVLAPNHNNLITKDNMDSLVVNSYSRTPGTTVAVSCYLPTTFTLVGPSKVVCSTNGRWTPELPKCIRKSSNNNNNNNKVDATDDNSNNASRPGDSDESILSDYSLIVIAVAAAFVVLLLITLLVFLCKHFGGRRKGLDEMREPMVGPSIEASARPKLAIVQVDNMFSSPSKLTDVYKGPSSPPSWHSHPIILMADNYKHRSWSQLSLDQYLREMDASRRENPNHSWRDFATLSSYYSHYSNSSLV